MTKKEKMRMREVLAEIKALQTDRSLLQADYEQAIQDAHRLRKALEDLKFSRAETKERREANTILIKSVGQMVQMVTDSLRE